MDYEIFERTLKTNKFEKDFEKNIDKVISHDNIYIIQLSWYVNKKHA